MELALYSVSGVISLVCIRRPREEYFIGITDSTESEIKAADPCLHLPCHWDISPPYLSCLQLWRADVTVNGNPPPENECNICSLAVQSLPRSIHQT